MQEIDSSVKRKLLKKMIEIRCFEEAVVSAKESDKILGPVHTCIGQEASVVGVCANLEKMDYVIGNHRSHGYMIAKGVDIHKMMAEIYGKSTGTNGGKGGSMHVNDVEHGALGSSGIVGSGLPTACGAAFASKYFNDGRVTCVFFGDGAAQEGTFHESLNLAAIWNIPVLFVLENNNLAVTTQLKHTTTTNKIYKRAEAYGMRSYNVNGQDVEQVYSISAELIERIRKDGSPAFLQIDTIRFREHQEGIGYKKIAFSGYRDNSAVEYDMIFNDPIKLYSNKLLLDSTISRYELDKIYLDANKNVADSVLFAEASPYPTADQAYVNVFCE